MLDKNEVYYSMGGLPQYFNSISEMFKYKITNDTKNIILNTSSQPNSIPHLGTLTTLMSVFAIAEELKRVYKLNVLVQFDEIECSPKEFIEVEGHKYVKSISDMFVESNISISDINMNYYYEILNFLKQESGINYQVRTYQEFQENKSKLTIALGKDVAGNTQLADIAKMPHVLIAGSTGSGKSVCVNTIITSIIYNAKPSEVKLVMVDPKVVELSVYNGIPHLLIPVVTDPKKAAGALAWAVQEMDDRYNKFATKGVRDLKGYNKVIEKEGGIGKLPQIVIIVDELADLMMVAAKDVEEAICRLAQKARAAGMHLVIATQRPSVDVITGLIKANIPSRIAFAVSSQVDSRTILDTIGAEKLLGKGDMLFFPSGAPKPSRVQGAFVSDEEVEKIVDFVKSNGTATYSEDILESIENNNKTDKELAQEQTADDDTDPFLMDAIQTVVETGQASTSFIQRRFKVGYARAGRIIDQMEERGVISGYQGSKPREVLMTLDKLNELKMGTNENDVVTQ